jgi:hypothetical protein
MSDDLLMCFLQTCEDQQVGGSSADACLAARFDSVTYASLQSMISGCTVAYCLEKMGVIVGQGQKLCIVEDEIMVRRWLWKRINNILSDGRSVSAIGVARSNAQNAAIVQK